MANQRKPGKVPTASARQERRDALFEQAMERPGIREVMRVYEDWKQADRALDSHRAIAAWRGNVANRANACDAE